MMMHAAHFRVVTKAPHGQRYKTKPKQHQRLIIINDSSNNSPSKATEANKSHQNLHESSGMPDNSILCGLSGCCRLIVLFYLS